MLKSCSLCHFTLLFDSDCTVNRLRLQRDMTQMGNKSECRGVSLFLYSRFENRLFACISVLFYACFHKKVIPLLRNPIFYDEKNNLIYPVDFMLLGSHFGSAFHGEIT